MNKIYESYLSKLIRLSKISKFNEITIVDENQFFLDFIEYVSKNTPIDFNRYKHLLGYYVKDYKILYRGWKGTEIDTVLKDGLNVEKNDKLATSATPKAIHFVCHEFSFPDNTVITKHSGLGLSVKSILQDALIKFKGDRKVFTKINFLLATKGAEEEVLINIRSRKKLTKKDIFGYWSTKYNKIIPFKL